MFNHLRAGFLSALIVSAALFPAAGQTVDITGTVVDSSTSQAIAGATASLVGFPQITATTEANGTFTLTGTATSVVRAGSLPTASEGAVLHGNALSLSKVTANSPVTAVVFAGNGARIAVSSATASQTGDVTFDNLLRSPGLFFVKIRSGSSVRFLAGLNQNGSIEISNSATSSSRAILAKTAASYTVQVTNPGYILKDVQVSSGTADAGTIRLAVEQEQTGVWQDVTPTGIINQADLATSANSFGPGCIVGDPAHPSDMYVGGANSGLLKSSDYGKTWTKINSQIPYVPRGQTLGIAGTTPATIWAGDYNVLWKSTDGGVTFTSKNVGYSFYSFVVDPNDNNHLLSGLHEDDFVFESTDGGSTWNKVSGSGWLSGGISWYPYFVNTGIAATTRQTWIAIAQNGASLMRTTDGGANWSVPNGVSGLQHPHGNNQIFQTGSTIFAAGTNGPNNGQGVYRSTDLGANWTRVDGGTMPEAVVWGTAKNVYAMYAWACSQCNLGTDFEIAALPGTTWKSTSVPSGLVIGPNSLVVAFNGSHYVFVGSMWSLGIWRYVEP